MHVHHPIALEDTGVVDDAVDVDGEMVAVADDGTFEIPDRKSTWLERWAAGYEYTVDELRVDAEEEEASGTCETVKGDGEVCGRDLPCPYHSDDEDEE